MFDVFPKNGVSGGFDAWRANIAQKFVLEKEIQLKLGSNVSFYAFTASKNFSNLKGSNLPALRTPLQRSKP